jgi:quercetin dioxygenase-like cupin family protein
VIVTPLADSQLALTTVEVDGPRAVGGDDADTLLFVLEGEGTLDGTPLRAESAALVRAGERASLDGRLRMAEMTVAPGPDLHAALGPPEAVVSVAEVGERAATGSRSFRVLFGPENGSVYATLFVGYIPPGRAPLHYHLYDEIVLVLSGTGRLHLDGTQSELVPGDAFRLRARQPHIVENLHASDELVVLGLFTPAGSPSAAYLVQGA